MLAGLDEIGPGLRHAGATAAIEAAHPRSQA
jgi:hypothetical protein